MKRFKNILYIIDSDISLEKDVANKVIALARLNNATVTVARVLEDGLFEQFGRFLFDSGENIINRLIPQLKEEGDTFVSSDIWSGIKVSAEVLQGKGFISIIQKVLRDKHDLVIKRGSAAEGIDQLAIRLIRKCPCPIWVIQGKTSGDLKRILAAVDATSEIEETTRLNTKIVELAYSLAQREEGESHFLNTWYLHSESMLRGPRFKLVDAEIQLMKQKLAQEGKEKLSALLESAHIMARPDHIHVLEGKTDTVIERVLESLQIEVLVLGTIGRSGIPGLLIGNTVEKLLAKVNCSVLAVKPDGFVSPVTI